MKYVLCRVFTANCHMTRGVYFLFAPEKRMATRKLLKKRLVKYVNIKIRQRLLVHIMFKVSCIDIWICNYSTLFTVVIELTNMSPATIMTGGITHCIYMLIHIG